jgi:hypothetical protein
MTSSALGLRMSGLNAVISIRFSLLLAIR